MWFRWTQACTPLRGDTLEIVVLYQGRGDEFGTPLVPVRVNVPSTLDVDSLKYIVCYATDFVADIMAIMLPLEPEPAERAYFAAQANFKAPDNLDSATLTHIFTARRISGNVVLAELDSQVLIMGIDINWLERCPVCGQENIFSKPEGVSGLDNVPDLCVGYSCSNDSCSERDRKSFYIYVAHWLGQDKARRAMPVITHIYSHGHCISPRVRRCCWDCGKKNRNLHSKPSALSSFYLEDLRRRVAVEEEKTRARIFERTIAINRELERLGILRRARVVSG